MKRKKIIIYGIGKLAEYVAYVFNNDSEYEVISHCIEKSYLKEITDQKNELLIYEDLTFHYKKQDFFLFVAVGNNLVRERIYVDAKNRGYKFATYVSTKAFIWKDLIVGENCFIGEGSVIQPYVKIGENCIVFSSRIGHHSALGNHVLLSATTLAGNVKIGEFSFLGVNSSIQQNLNIGPKNIIGMGVAIKTSTGEGEVYSSAKFLKRKSTFEDISNKYLN